MMTIEPADALDHWLGGVQPLWRDLPYELLVIAAEAPIEDTPLLNMSYTLPDSRLAHVPVLRLARLLLERLDDQTWTPPTDVAPDILAAIVDAKGGDPGTPQLLTRHVVDEDYLLWRYVQELVVQAHLVQRPEASPVSIPGTTLFYSEPPEPLLRRNGPVDLPAGRLMNLLFETACGELICLDRLDEVSDWPQTEVDLVLALLLGETAADGQTAATIARLSADPGKPPPGHHLYDILKHAFERRLLWPLVWFGLLETAPCRPCLTSPRSGSIA
jgi:hypothetical protein